MQKVIITVVGRDAVGIIAKVCTYLSESHCNILNIDQTITGGFFNMMMIVDLSGTDKKFSDIHEDLKAVGESIGVSVHMQREEIFDMMHRV